jgi:hypothetical protein
MSITITAEQRNLLYDEMLERLSGIDDVRLAIERDDCEAAQRLGLIFSDDLRLVTEDLGWGEDAPSETIELGAPADVLRRSLGRLRERVEALDASEERERSELRKNQERNQLVVETCRQLLAYLDEHESFDLAS